MIRHSRGSYPIELTHPDRIREEGVWLIDANVLKAWPQFAAFDPIVVPAGEASKSIDTYAYLLQELAKRGVRRDGRLIALGGGVIGDLVGFVASTYLRGIPFVQVPTTLLAMVDSSVGGKVGIDLPQGKNLVGAFWPPDKVILAVDFLRTLEPRQFTNGMAEAWKYAFIEDPQLADELSSPAMHVESVISRCIAIKAKVVEEDEHDRTGRRAILNFGHTFGHAIEVANHYESYLHGEVISIGMVAEARLGERLGLTQPGTAEAIRHSLDAAGLPTTYDRWQEQAIFEAMRLDKKNEGTGLAFSLVTELGRCKLVTGISEADVRGFLESL